MLLIGKTFRVFVSSTFSDLMEERNALQKYVFSRLRDLCMQHGFRFQAIDLRWGISKEAGRDQQTMKISLEEIKRCQNTKLRPNFIVLLGERYGWCPLPSEIPEDEFDQMKGKIEDAGNLITHWYLCDKNSIPPVYCLRERRVNVAEDASEDERKSAQDIEYKGWKTKEKEIRSILLEAIEKLGWQKNDPRRVKYKASATEHEINLGVFDPEDAKKHVFCFFRTIDGLPQDITANDFRDIDDKGNLNKTAQTQLNNLKERLEKQLLGNVLKYNANWNRYLFCWNEIPGNDDGIVIDYIKKNFYIDWLQTAKIVKSDNGRTIKISSEKNSISLILDNEKNKLNLRIDDDTAYEFIVKMENNKLNIYDNSISRDHIGCLPQKLDDCLKISDADTIPTTLCVDVWKKLSKIIKEEIANFKDDDALEKEIENHNEFGKNRAMFFVGRESPLKKISDHVKGKDTHPLAVFGVSGSGKSALMARAVEQAKSEHENAVVIVRFIGATPESSDGRALLESLCRQISRRYGADESTVPNDYKKLVEEFLKNLSLATSEKPLFIFLDALDQLSNTYDARDLIWIPQEMALHVHLVISTLPIEEKKLHMASRIELEKMLPVEGVELLDTWLENAHRKLEEYQKEEVLKKFEKNGLPLYLKLAFEEVRKWKSYDDVFAGSNSKQRLGEDIPGIIHNIFSRLSNESNHGKMFVSRSMGYLAASKNGLTEDELLDVFSRDTELYQDFINRSRHTPTERRLPVVIWSRLYFDLEPYLTWRGELLDFYHGQFRAVVEKTYLQPDERKYASHEQLADYFHHKADPQCDGTWSGIDMRALRQVPYHQFHARLFLALNETLCAKPFIARLDREEMMGNLELGLEAARKQDSWKYAMSVLMSWGYVLTSQKINTESLITQLVNEGNVKQAIRIILNELPPSDGIHTLTRLGHEAIDHKQITVLDMILSGLLILKGASSMESIREQLRLIDRSAGLGRWEALKLLSVQRSEDTALRILMFMIGTSHFSQRVAEELRNMLAKLDEPYWRGVCQLALCLRAICSRLPVADSIARDLAKTLSACSRTVFGVELGILVARSYRWLHMAGFQLSDFGDSELEKKVNDKEIISPPVPLAPASDVIDSTGTFDFIPHGERPVGTHGQNDWSQIARQAISILVDGGRIQCVGDSIAGNLQHAFDRALAESNGRRGHPLFWMSLLPPMHSRALWQSNIDIIDLHKLPQFQRLEILLSLRRMGDEDTARFLLSAWSSSVSNSEDKVDFLQALKDLSPWPLACEMIHALDNSFRSALNSPPPDVCIALIASQLRLGQIADATYWLERLRSVVAPSMALPMHYMQDVRTLRAYVLLNIDLPIKPSDQAPDSLLRSAREHATGLGTRNKWLTSLLSEEFGLRTPPLSYLADRILAFWIEDAAFVMGSGTMALQHYVDFLKLGMVTDDRERLRSWFLWLLAIIADPNAAQMACWKQGVREARALRFRYEVAFLRILDSRDLPESSLVLSTEDKLATFAALAAVVRQALIDVKHQILGLWAGAALSCFYETQDQAAAFAHLAEASARMGLPELTHDYLTTVHALDTDLAPFAHERATLGGLSIDGTLDDLRQWYNPRTFQEACESVLKRLCESRQSHDLLELTQFLRQTPNLWSQMVIALCRASSDSEDAQVVFEMLLHRLHDQG